MNRMDIPQLIGSSRDVLQIQRQIRQVAQSNAPVLIRGESGAGKQLVAELIRLGSARAKKPFIRIHCAAVPEPLIDGELFGKESENLPCRPGAFEAAREGTVLLDEVAALPLSAQARLLHVLQEREFERCGGDIMIPMTARLLATSDRPLEQLLRDGRFHAGLYYQLGVFPIYLPPLRERKADIPLLVNFFIDRNNAKLGRNVKSISAPALHLLVNHTWPGNVRELEDAIEHALCVSSNGVIHPEDLPYTVRMCESMASQPEDLKTMLGSLEKGAIVDALRSHHGNMAAAARQLGLSERMVSLRVQKYGIDPETFKQQPSRARKAGASPALLAQSRE